MSDTHCEADDLRLTAGRTFSTAVQRFDPDRPVLVLGHFDADGLSATAILARALGRAGRSVETRLVGKGENPWSAAMRSELEARRPGGLIVTDLGVREGDILPGAPTVIVDHHVPTGTPGDALVISGNGRDPEPTSALLALWCAAGMGDADDLLWLAAVGLIGDMAEAAGFAEMAQAQARYGKTALRNAVSLINAPRRAAAADASPALALLMKGEGPKDVTSGRYPETAALLAAKAEVAAALEAAKRAPPVVRGDVALIGFSSASRSIRWWRKRGAGGCATRSCWRLTPATAPAGSTSPRAAEREPISSPFSPSTGPRAPTRTTAADTGRRRAARCVPPTGTRSSTDWGSPKRGCLRDVAPRHCGPGSHTPILPIIHARNPLLTTARPLRLGFPVKVMGRPGLKSGDTRRWQQGPHLKTSLEYLDAILDYLAAVGLDMYRLSSDIAPYATHPDMPQFHSMVADSDAELRAFGDKAHALDIRLSFHPSQYVLLNSPNPELTAKSIWDLASQAEMLDRMGAGPEAVLVTHVGGVYDDHAASRARWIDGWNRCPAHVQARLVLENDDIRFSAADALWIHERTGVRLVFDYQHFWCLNPERLEMRTTLEAFLRTWPAGVRPKVHFSSPRTELREVKRAIKPAQRAAAKAGKAVQAAKTGGRKGELLKSPIKAGPRIKTVLLPPIWAGHSDFTNPFEFATFMRMAGGLEFDVMMEGKSKDLSLLKLRPDLLRFAPDVAARFGIHPEAAARLEADERRLEEGVAAEAEADVDEGAASLSQAA